MKKLVYTVFVTFWAAVATLVVLHGLEPQSMEEQLQETGSPEEPTVYSLSEVAKHDTLENCWMSIEGVVYDVSDYVPHHPAPPRVLEPWCGREATVGMRTKDNNSDHSARAWRMLERYRIGRLLNTARQNAYAR